MGQIPGQYEITFYVMGVIFVATLIRSSLGFGEALIGVPLLALKIPLKTAAPLAVTISITVAAFIVIQDWKKVHVRSVAWLLLPTVFGIPLGLLLLTSQYQHMAKIVLAVVIIGFGIYFLCGTHVPELKRDSKRWLVLFGFFAGVFGGAYGMNGPPLAVYGTMRRWSPQHFRATLQGYFLPASMLGALGFFWKGLMSRELAHYYLWSLPVTIPAIYLGRIANHRLPHEIFRKYVFAGLIVIGVLLAVEALR